MTHPSTSYKAYLLMSVGSSELCMPRRGFNTQQVGNHGLRASKVVNGLYVVPGSRKQRQSTVPSCPRLQQPHTTVLTFATLHSEGHSTPKCTRKYNRRYTTLCKTQITQHNPSHSRTRSALRTATLSSVRPQYRPRRQRTR